MANPQEFWDKFHELSTLEKFWFKIKLNSYFPTTANNHFVMFDPEKLNDVAESGESLLGEINGTLIEINDQPNTAMQEFAELMQKMYDRMLEATKLPTNQEGCVMRDGGLRRSIPYQKHLTIATKYLNENTDKLPEATDLIDGQA